MIASLVYMKSRTLMVLGWMVLVLLCSAPIMAGTAMADETFPDPLGYVSDYAGVLDQEWEARIRSVCRDLEKKTGVEMVVVTTKNIHPYLNVNEYASDLYKHWRIGSAQREHGVLVLAYTKKSQATVTLGRNMIRVIPPGALEEMRQQYIDPTFRTGEYGEGVYRTVVALAAASGDVRLEARRRPHSAQVAFVVMLLVVATILTLFWMITRPDKRHPFPKIQRGEYWGTGQGGFGGNFGGFGLS